MKVEMLVRVDMIEREASRRERRELRLDLGCEQDIRPLEAGRSIGFTDHKDCFLATLSVAITDHDPRPFASKRHRRRAADS